MILLGDLKMGIIDFYGETFVAYIDISGFKHIMKNKKLIAKVVYDFYRCGYDVLNKYRNGDEPEDAKVQGIFVSDCGIVFVNTVYEEHKNNLDIVRESLDMLLGVIKDMNIRMLETDIMLTTSIAYGELYCTKKVEFKGISKNPVYGDAYLQAFLDSENRQNKLNSGECRIVKRNLPNNIINKESKEKYEYFRYLKDKGRYRSHLYYYWMLQDETKIIEYNLEYSNLENEKYRKKKKLLKKYIIMK